MIQFSIRTHSYSREKPTVSADLWSVKRVVTDSDGWQFPFHMLDCPTLLYTDSGSLICTVNSRAIPLREGELICLAAGARFSMCSDHAGRNCFYFVKFECSDLSFLPLKEGCYSASIPREMREFFFAMYRAMSKPEHNKLVGECYLLLILEEILRLSKDMPAKQALYDKIRLYILENAYADISAEDIADALGYSKDYLCRVVRLCSGKTIKYMITEERINAAKGLLSSTNYSIEKIASLLKFPSSNSFLKYFKYHVSMTPSEYRRRE